jgi:hypothetical protein
MDMGNKNSNTNTQNDIMQIVEVTNPNSTPNPDEITPMACAQESALTPAAKRAQFLKQLVDGYYAFAMSGHSRLGANSSARVLSNIYYQLIFEYLIPVSLFIFINALITVYFLDSCRFST